MLAFSFLICGLIAIISLVGIVCLLFYVYSYNQRKSNKNAIANERQLLSVDVEKGLIILSGPARDKCRIHNNIDFDLSVLLESENKALNVSQKSSKSHIDKNIDSVINYNKIGRKKVNWKNVFLGGPLDNPTEHRIREGIIYGNN